MLHEDDQGAVLGLAGAVELSPGGGEYFACGVEEAVSVRDARLRVGGHVVLDVDYEEGGAGGHFGVEVGFGDGWMDVQREL